MSERRKLRLNKNLKGKKFKSKTPLSRKTEFKQMINENVDYDDKSSVLSVKNVVDTVSVTASAVKTTGQAANKAVSISIKGISGAREIATRVNRIRHTPLTSRNVREITGRAYRSGIKLAKNAAISGGKLAGKTALDVRDRVLSASIDKSKVTDTGMETINQGITYIRYADNARRAVINTEKGAVKGIKTSAKVVKNTAVRTKQTVKAIAKAGKKAASVVGKVVTSKAMPVILAAAAIILIVQLISNVISSFVMMIGGVFSWAGDDETDYKAQIEKYIDTVKEIVSDEQQKIDDVYYGFECDKTEYEPCIEITAFREERFTYREIPIDSDEEYTEIIALTAAKWYSETLLSDETPDDFKLKKSELEDMVRNFFELDYDYEEDYCPHYDECCIYGNIMTGGNAFDGIYADDVWYCDKYYHGCKEIRQWYERDETTGEWLWDNEITGIRSYCDRKHNYLKGEVKIFTLDEVKEKLNLTDEEKDMYEVYYETIDEWLAEE